jgi:hypothetical protein
LRTGYNVRVWSITRNVTSAPDFAEATASTTDAADTPPIIQINGDNPAIIQVGDTYNDLGATIPGPQADLNLGITTYLKGTLTSNIVIDTTQPATDTIDYVATDQCSGPGSLNRFSASLSGVSAGVRLPCGWAAG